MKIAPMKISIYAPYAKERSARQHSTLHPERIVGDPKIPRDGGEERALRSQSNSVKTFPAAASV
jgi:hypothetical protein